MNALPIPTSLHTLLYLHLQVDLCYVIAAPGVLQLRNSFRLTHQTNITVAIVESIYTLRN